MVHSFDALPGNVAFCCSLVSLVSSLSEWSWVSIASILALCQELEVTGAQGRCPPPIYGSGFPRGGRSVEPGRRLRAAPSTRNLTSCPDGSTRARRLWVHAELWMDLPLQSALLDIFAMKIIAPAHRSIMRLHPWARSLAGLVPCDPEVTRAPRRATKPSRGRFP